jgi:hypothetical protein
MLCNGGNPVLKKMKMRAVLTTLAVAAFGLGAPATPSFANVGVTGAAFTSVNVDADGAGHCKNGNPDINCNIYDLKRSVWLNGGPGVADVGDGSYFFAVLDPGGQADPNDFADKNLSDDVDAYGNRTFTVTGGVVSYPGTHDFNHNKIRLAGDVDYADTTNPGGVYIMAICSLANGYPVQASSCKYDAFKVSPEPVVPAKPLTVTKDAHGSYTQTYAWNISKDVDRTTVKQVGGIADFNYTVGVGHDSGTVSGVTVTGTITVFNPNVDSADNPLPVTGVNVTDQLSGGRECVVTGGSDQTITALETTFAYSCALTDVPQGQLDNTASVEWPSQFLDNDNLLSDGSADFTFTGITFSADNVDECAVVTDSFAGALGTVCVGDPNPTSFPYSRSIAVTSGCSSYDNTATFTANDSYATGSASKTVTVCGPARTGALTIGYWQNKNGQAVISGGYSAGTVCSSATWLRQYAPFQDLSATAKCSAVATYVTNVIKAANASGSSMNAMLKAQMLATALDVYFSDPALGGNKIGAPAPVGGAVIDLTKVCSNPLTCSSFINATAAFGGSTEKTVGQILSYAASQSNSGGGTWYANVKTTQEMAKDVFDAINNQVAFGV